MASNPNPNFRKATDVYYDRIKLKPTNNNHDTLKYDKSKYARAAQLGLCFHCFREDTDPNHRPRHASFGFCKECMSNMDLGYTKTETQKEQEVYKWFKE